MAKSLNKVMLIGNLGKDPEIRYTPGGDPVANFTLATNESWKDKEGNLQERTEWHNIVAWRRLAEFCGEWLKKGKKVYIEGRIQTRSYEDKNSGQKKSVTEIVSDNIIMLDSRPQGEGGPGSYGASSNNFGRQSNPSSTEGTESPSGQGGGKGEMNPDDDLPF
jgi:single-strand DNA-binding protein